MKAGQVQQCACPIFCTFVPMLMQATQLYKSYGTLNVLKGVSMEMSQGEVVALVGASGAGKSTLLQLLGTLDAPDSGSIFFQGKDLSKLGAKAQAQYRNEAVGFVFQFHHLLPEFTALENVCMPAWIAKKPEKEVLAKAQGLLTRLGLADKMNNKPAQLSGGEAQRVAVARALINEPAMILADEPTGNLDTANSEALFALMCEIARETRTAFLVVTHNDLLAARADRCYRMKDGLIEATQLGE